MTSRIPTDGEINSLSPGQFKIYENRVRRMASRQGLRLIKSRRRDPRATDYGTYVLVDEATNTVVQGNYHGGFASITDVEHILTTD